MRNVNAGLSPISVFFAWVQDWLIACADMASASVIFDRTFPAWRVLSKQRHSSVVPKGYDFLGTIGELAERRTEKKALEQSEALL